MTSSKLSTLANFQTKKGSMIGPVLLYLIWPFLTFLAAIRNYRKPWAKNLFWLFTIFFGYTIISTGDYTDIQGYILDFERIAKLDFSFEVFSSSFYAEDSGLVDPIIPSITFLISRFTTNPKILTACFAVIYGFFYSRNIWYLINLSNKRLKISEIYILIIFSLIVGMWEMNVFRFMTATHIFLFGTMPYLIEKKNKMLAIAALSIFVHFSFILPVALLIIHKILGNRLGIFYIIYLISFFINEINFEFLKESLSYFPMVFQERATIYIDENFADVRVAAFEIQSWHLKFSAAFIRYSILVLSTTIFLKFRNQKQLPWLKSLFSFTLLFLFVFNILSNVPGLDRFPRLGYLLFFAFYFLYTVYYNYSINKLIFKLVSPFLLFYCLVQIRFWLGFMGISTLFGNPFTVYVFDGEESLINILKRTL